MKSMIVVPRKSSGPENCHRSELAKFTTSVLPVGKVRAKPQAFPAGRGPVAPAPVVNVLALRKLCDWPVGLSARPNQVPNTE